MSRRSEFRPGQPVKPEVAYFIASYRPKWSEADLSTWDNTIGERVRSWTTYAGPPSVQTAKNAISQTSPYVLWVYSKDGSVTADEVWDPDNVEHWVTKVNANRSDAWRKTHRAALRRFGPLFASKSVWPTPAVAIPRGRVAAPYSEEQERTFAIAARSASGETRARRLFVVAAGFGAGLDGRDLPAVTADRIVDIGAGRLAIALRPGHAPKVPVRSAYSDMLREAVLLAGDRPLLGQSGRNAVSRATSLIRVGLDGKLNASRMRSTWIVHHLRNGTPLPYLARIAGLETPKRVVELIQFVDDIDEAAASTRALLA
jgi:hypothetical protein